MYWKKLHPLSDGPTSLGIMVFDSPTGFRGGDLDWETLLYNARRRYYIMPGDAII